MRERVTSREPLYAVFVQPALLLPFLLSTAYKKKEDFNYGC